MIKNDRQYKASKEQIERLKEGLGEPQASMPDVIYSPMVNSTKSLIKEIQDQIDEYDLLKKQGVNAIKIRSWNDLFLLPIKYRVAKSMTIEQFAQKVEVHSRQIANYEKEEYRNVSASTLEKILEKLDTDPSHFFGEAA